MVNKRIILFLLLGLVLNSCEKFKGEKIVINYKDGYVKVLSNDYIIDSLAVYNHINKYFIIGSTDKSKGENVIFFKRKNLGYKIYTDSLDFYCDKIPEVESPGLNIVIRRKGFKGSENGENYTDIQYLYYGEIPCKSELIDTITTNNPYK